MRSWLFAAFAALALLARASGAEYAGQFCSAVVDFPLADDTDFVDADKDAMEGYAMFPRWVTRRCLAAIWKYSCMISYGKHAQDGEGYCRESCMATMDECQQTIDILPADLAKQYTDILLLMCNIAATTNEGCHSGATVAYDDIPPDYGTVCPKPLGTIKPGSDADTERIPGTACNTGCPAIILTSDEWNHLITIGKWCTLCSAILSLVVILSHREEKNLYIRYLNLGAMLVNMVLFAFLVTDEYVPQTCLDDGYYRKRSDFCYVQAVVTISGYIWMSSWQACIAINLWLSVVLQAKRALLEKARAAFLPVSTALAILSPAICLAGQNIGYDWAGYSGPVCLLLFSKDSTYYWTLLFAPVAVVVTVCLTLTIHTGIHVNMVLANSKAANDSFFSRIGKMLKYNKKLVLFICCFALMSGYHSGQILYDNLSPEGGGFKTSAEDYIACLLEATVADPNSGMEECGDKPKERPALWRVAMLVMYATTIGIMSFLVYGTQNKVQQSISSSVKSIRSLRTGIKTTEAKHLVNDTAAGSTTDPPPPERSQQSTFMEILRSSFVSITRLTAHDLPRESEIQIEMAEDHAAPVDRSSHDSETKISDET